MKQNKNRLVVYTAIFNNYDTLKDPVVAPHNVDFICYTDSDKIISNIWEIRKLDLGTDSPSLLNRKIKLLYPYTELVGYEYSLYVDGSIQIRGDVSVFLYKYTASKPVLMNFKHPNNDCIFEEMIRCIRQKRGSAPKLIEQYNIYSEAGMPEHYGMSDNKIILRNNHSDLGKQMMEEWYQHVTSYSGRDQVCLSFILWKNCRKYDLFEENIEENMYFETWPHTNGSKLQWIWRKFKWFCDRHQICQGLIRFLNNKVKKHFI